MKTGQFSDEQIVAILQKAAKGEKTISALCQAKEISEATFYAWRNKLHNRTKSTASYSKATKVHLPALKKCAMMVWTGEKVSTAGVKWFSRTFGEFGFRTGKLEPWMLWICFHIPQRSA